MSSHRFRSQPALQRSGGHGPPAVVGIGLLAAAGVAAGALIGFQMQVPSSPAGPGGSWGGLPVDQAAPAAALARLAAAPPPVVAPTPAPITAAAATAPPHGLLKAKALAAVKPPRAVKPARVVAMAEPPAETYEDQQRDYQKARAAYDADERTAGFRWAQQNNIRLQRYCRVASQRTPAFVEGCMSYLRPHRGDTADRPADDGARPSEQG